MVCRCAFASFRSDICHRHDSEKRVQGTPSKMYQINSKISQSFRLNRGTVVMDDIRTKGTSFSERLKLAPLNPMSLSTYTGPMASCITKACSHRHLAPVQTMDRILPKKVGFQGSNLESSWIVGRSEKKFQLLGSRWLFWRKGSWSLATGPIKSDPNHTCGWYTLVLVISLVEVGLW